MFTVCAFQGRRAGLGLVDSLLGPAGVRVRTVMQGILGGLLLLSMFNAIKHVPLGNSSAIMFCTPVFTFIFAPCMLREQCGLYRYDCLQKKVICLYQWLLTTIPGTTPAHYPPPPKKKSKFKSWPIF